VLIYVEGQTEERFVKQLLAPHLLKLGVFATPTIAKTKLTRAGPHFKGGVTSYAAVKRDLLRLLGDTSAAAVTTMIDYFRLPEEFPGQRSLPVGTCHEKVAHLERELGQDIGHLRFMPYLQLHEFEALLFAGPGEIASAFPGEGHQKDVVAIRAQFESPEEIDDGETTAPARRLEALFPRYQKPFHGPLISARIGLDRIRAECAHFRQWLAMLENLGG
jgi:hypothetical protein